MLPVFLLSLIYFECLAQNDTEIPGAVIWQQTIRVQDLRSQSVLKYILIFSIPPIPGVNNT